MSGQPLNREVTLTLLRDRLALLNRTVSNRRVEVTDISQIQDCEVKVNVSLFPSQSNVRDDEMPTPYFLTYLPKVSHLNMLSYPADEGI